MLSHRPGVPARSEELVQRIPRETAAAPSAATDARIARLAAENRRIHDIEGLNLNPASNVMNPRAEALLASGLGTRASLGWPGDMYPMGLEATARIEVVAAALAAFGAGFVEDAPVPEAVTALRRRFSGLRHVRAPAPARMAPA